MTSLSITFLASQGWTMMFKHEDQRMFLTSDHSAFAYFLVSIPSPWGPFFITLVKNENEGSETEGRKEFSHCRGGCPPLLPLDQQPDWGQARRTHPGCSWWQMTEASESSQWLPQTVPQAPFAYTSTVPSNSCLPPWSRTDPEVEKNPKTL